MIFVWLFILIDDWWNKNMLRLLSEKLIFVNEFEKICVNNIKSRFKRLNKSFSSCKSWLLIYTYFKLKYDWTNDLSSEYKIFNVKKHNNVKYDRDK